MPKGGIVFLVNAALLSPGTEENGNPDDGFETGTLHSPADDAGRCGLEVESRRRLECMNVLRTGLGR
jgi:hypothetical protein